MTEAHGYKEITYSTGHIMGKGNFDHGKRIGHWKWFYNSGKLQAEGNYINNLPIGYWKYYHFNGNMIEKKFFC